MVIPLGYRLVLQDENFNTKLTTDKTNLKLKDTRDSNCTSHTIQTKINQVRILIIL